MMLSPGIFAGVRDEHVSFFFPLSTAKENGVESVEFEYGTDGKVSLGLYCIVLYLLPVRNPKSYDGARVLEALGHPMLVIGRS